jgi:hypothetical protein
MMCQFLTAKPKAHPTSTQQPPKGSSHTAQANAVPNTSKEQTLSTEIFTGYLSNLLDDLPQLEDDVNTLVDSEQRLTKFQSITATGGGEGHYHSDCTAVSSGGGFLLC